MCRPRRAPAGRTAWRGLTAGALLLAGAACRQDMFDQPRVKPLAASAFHDDGASARAPVEGTVARTAGGPPAAPAAPPAILSRELLLRGRERYEIFCSPCHGRTGDGQGMIVQRGFKAPSSYHVDRLRQQPLGYYVDVITNGFGQMSSYAAQVPAGDRWAIAAYIRALQQSQHAAVADLAEDDRRALEALGREPR